MSGLSVQLGALWEGMVTLCNVETRATENVPGNADFRHHIMILSGDAAREMFKLSVCFACVQKKYWFDGRKHPILADMDTKRS